MKDNDKVQCPLCLNYYKSLATGHLTRKHGITSEDLLKQYPTLQLSSPSMLAHRGAKIKANWDNKSEDQKQSFSNKMSETMSSWYYSLPEEDKLRWSERSRNNMVKYLDNMTPLELEEYKRYLSTKAKSQDLTAFLSSRIEGHDKWLLSLKNDPEAYAAYCSKLSKAQHDRFASMTAEELKAHMLRSLCPRKNTAPELTMLEALTSLGHVYSAQYKIGRHQVDAYVPSLNLVVEMYGDYWHAGIAYFSDEAVLHPTSKETLVSIREKDEARLANIASLGYRTLVIWESEILANADFPSYLSQKISTVIPSQA